MEPDNDEDTEFPLADCDFCINCNTVLLKESAKVSKILRTMSAKPRISLASHQHSKSLDDDSMIKIQVSLAQAICLTFKIDDFMEVSGLSKMSGNHFVCEKCGHLLELAYNAIQDFMELTRRGSLLMDKLKTKSVATPALPSQLQGSMFKLRERETHSKGTENATLQKSQRISKSANNIIKGDSPNQKKISQQVDNLDWSKHTVKENTVKSENPEPFNCTVCPKSFSSQTLLSKHTQLFHRKKSNLQRRSLSHQQPNEETLHEKTSIDLSLNYCNLCDQDTNELEKHIKMHEEVDAELDGNCVTDAAQFDDFDLADSDPCWDKIKCKLCSDGDSNTMAELKEHYSKEHPLVSILTVHDMHQDGKIGVGAASNDDDDTSMSLGKNNLLKGTSGRLIFNCNVCNKRFIRHDHIKLHLRTHTGEKPFICHINGCEKAFSDPRGLAYHEITHSNERPYCCKFCGMTFKRLHHLNDHERNHNDVSRPFICQCCNKAFKHRKHLNSHLIIHQGTREHQCKLCFKAFNRKDNLQQHLKKVHGRQPTTDNVENDVNKAESGSTGKVPLISTTVFPNEIVTSSIVVSNAPNNQPNSPPPSVTGVSSSSNSTSSIHVSIAIADQDQTQTAN